MKRRSRTLEVDSSAGDPELQPDMPFVEGRDDQLDPELRHRLISEAAFHLYERRGFEDGYDLDDWLEAEAQIDHTIQKPAEEDSGQ